MRLTDLRIKQLRVPEAGQKTYFDDALPGFGVRVSQGGSKSFVVMYGQRRQLKTLGRYPALSLAVARKEAKRVQADADLHVPPVLASKLTFGEATERFLRDSATRHKARTTEDYRRLLSRHFDFPGHIHEIQKADVLRALEDLSHTPSEQHHAYVAIRTLLNWCVKRGLLDHSPVPVLSFKTVSRERILDDAELLAVWQQTEAVGYPFGTIVQLLILTGQRRGEIGQLRRSWLQGDAVVFPSGFTKNKREHRWPLGERTQAIIASLPNTSDLVFPSRFDQEKPFNGWAKSKRHFDAPLALAPYTLHDLRRTYSSNLARLGVPIHITEKLLNHATGTITGVAAIYNRYSYQDEMREAVTAYEQFVVDLVASNST